MPRLNRILITTVRLSAWPLLVLMILYFVSGYALCGLHGLGSLMSVEKALAIHKALDLPLLAILLAHTLPATWLAIQRWRWIGKRDKSQTAPGNPNGRQAGASRAGRP
jgi:cytochrome b subunit of formate dehydrogenase